jgi:S-adenosylmethionine:tRNA ribosyltransferase-isomerase
MLENDTPPNLDDYDFELPMELIAQAPTPVRSASRLLVLDRAHGRTSDQQFAQLPNLLRAGDLLVVNDTRVINARMRGVKASGGSVEILLERQLSDDLALAQVRTNRPLRPGATVELFDANSATLAGLVLSVVARHADLFELRASQPWELVLGTCGQLPLPPYIEREVGSADAERYQTVFAAAPGAVAAPTAGLHFDAAMLRALAAAGIEHQALTLHVGAGTFQPIRGDIASHKMHSERYQLDAALCAKIASTRAAGGRIVAVGTTVVRALESAALAMGPPYALGAHAGDTQLFIRPGFQFRIVDALITNFHLPRTTLLMLVSALSSRQLLLDGYRHAVRERYRFFSYGDAMLVL